MLVMATWKGSIKNSREGVQENILVYSTAQ